MAKPTSTLAELGAKVLAAFSLGTNAAVVGGAAAGAADLAANGIPKYRKGDDPKDPPDTESAQVEPKKKGKGK